MTFPVQQPVKQPKTEIIRLRLPWPPSVNGLYATVYGRRVLSSRGRDFHQHVATLCRIKFGLMKPITGRVRVEIIAHPPDRRVRDLSNILKVLEDAMTGAKVWQDDGQVDDLRIIRAAVNKPGYVDVDVTEIA